MFCDQRRSYYEPHVVRQILNEQGSVVERKDPVLVRETVSQSTSDFLKEAMFQTVENGTGGAAKVAGYQVAVRQVQQRSSHVPQRTIWYLSQVLHLQMILSCLYM